jgi:hypothetical protein
MRPTPVFPRSVAAAACVLALAACDNDPTAAGANCDVLEQTSAQVQEGRSSGLAQVRVNIISRLGVSATSAESIGLDGVALYQGNQCVRLVTTSSPALGSIENDMGSTIAEAAVELGEITHVVLLPSSGAQTTYRLQGEKLALAQPVRLEPGLRTEVFVALDPVAGSNDVATRFVAAGPVPSRAGAVMVAEPGRGGTMTTRGGFSLELGPQSMSVPTVYSVVEHDVGGISPLLEISPQGALGAKGTVRFRADPGRVPQGLAMSDFGVRVGGNSVNHTMSGNNVSVPVSSLGLMSMGTSKGMVEFADGTRMALPPAPAGSVATDGPRRAITVDNTCSRRLVAQRANYYGMVQRNMGIRIFDCEDVAPYVHIVLVNMQYPGSTYYPQILFPANWYTNTNTFLLNTIATLASTYGGSAFTAINGFYWDGDEGTAAGQTGVPAGHVYINGARRGSTIAGAEAVIGFTRGSQTGGTAAAMFNKASGGTVSLGTYNWNAVSSTTSIIRNGACSRTAAEGGDNTWSAIGFGRGILVLASSVSGTSTTAYELCSVFEGLDVLGGAIRLDGGPSAAIYWQGNHLNPLSGMAWWKYGDARHLAYGIGAKAW